MIVFLFISWYRALHFHRGKYGIKNGHDHWGLSLVFLTSIGKASRSCILYCILTKNIVVISSPIIKNSLQVKSHEYFFPIHFFLDLCTCTLNTFQNRWPSIVNVEYKKKTCNYLLITTYSTHILITTGLRD